ncbi:translation initiation factor eIF-1A [Methanohalophilus sp.]|uniref:translation initiation factor eIF-1A n=1 Tax=Methanohalophilus sp. TaxID=1966352 RepID=UPI0026326026|nr:translation initiation factor eIF-1A [Methanohalophilus sp.]MDK2892847.1 translation initiation factor [Methanohalophilus sp.]
MPENNKSPGEKDRLKVRLPRKENREVLATVESMLGANRVRLNCMDGVIRIGRIIGSMKNDTWLKVGDLVIAVPWDFQDTKADIIWKYTRQEYEWLQDKGYFGGKT